MSKKKSANNKGGDKAYTNLSTFVFVSTFFFSSYSNAQTHLSELDYLSDLPVASSVSRFPQALNKTPASVIIIDREMIEASGAMDIPDLFRLIPGFQVYSPANSHQVINYHTIPSGFPSSMDVKIDGRSAYEPFTNTVFWMFHGIEVEDIDYIEVVRGSNISSHGANALTGSINIVTKSPLEEAKTTLRLEAGSKNTNNISLGYSDTQGNLSYRLSTRYKSNTGFKDLANPDINDDFESIYSQINLLWVPSLQDSISVQLGYTDADFVFDQGILNPRAEDFFDWNVSVAFQHINWQRELNENNAIELLFHHTETKIDAVQSIALLSELIGADPSLVFPGAEDFPITQGVKDGLSNQYDMEFSHTGQSGFNFRFDWGFSARVHQVTSLPHFSTTSAVSENYYRLFGNGEYSATNWLTLNGGVSLGHSSTIGEHPSFRLAANIHLNAHNTIRLSANKAKRAPTTLDTHYYRSIHQGDTVYDVFFLTDPNIEAEKLESFELGYYGYFLNGDLTLDIKLYTEDYSNLLFYHTDNNSNHPQSIDGVIDFRSNSLMSKNQGVEAFAQWRPNLNWLISFQYAHTSIKTKHVRETNPVKILDYDNATPKHISSLLVNYDFNNGFQAAATYYYQSSVDWRDSIGTAESYSRLDVNIRKKFRIANIDARVEFIAQNLFGEDYTDYHSFQQFKPGYYLRLITEF